MLFVAGAQAASAQGCKNRQNEGDELRNVISSIEGYDITAMSDDLKAIGERLSSLLDIRYSGSAPEPCLLLP